MLQIHIHLDENAQSMLLVHKYRNSFPVPICLTHMNWIYAKLEWAFGTHKYLFFFFPFCCLDWKPGELDLYITNAFRKAMNNHQSGIHQNSQSGKQSLQALPR